MYSPMREPAGVKERLILGAVIAAVILIVSAIQELFK